MCSQNLEVLEDFFSTRVHGAFAAIGVLAFPKAGVSDRHDFSGHQVSRRLWLKLCLSRRINRRLRFPGNKGTTGSRNSDNGDCFY